jgi:hypothetical protein
VIALRRPLLERVGLATCAEACARLSLPSLDLPTFSSISTETDKIRINTNVRKYGKSKLKHIHAYQSNSTNTQTKLQYKIKILLIIIFIQSFYQTLGVQNPTHYVNPQIKLYKQHAIDENNYPIPQTTHNQLIKQHKEH